MIKPPKRSHYKWSSHKKEDQLSYFQTKQKNSYKIVPLPTKKFISTDPEKHKRLFKFIYDLAITISKITNLETKFKKYKELADTFSNFSKQNNNNSESDFQIIKKALKFRIQKDMLSVQFLDLMNKNQTTKNSIIYDFEELDDRNMSSTNYLKRITGLSQTSQGHFLALSPERKKKVNREFLHHYKEKHLALVFNTFQIEEYLETVGQWVSIYKSQGIPIQDYIFAIPFSILRETDFVDLEKPSNAQKFLADICESIYENWSALTNQNNLQSPKISPYDKYHQKLEELRSKCQNSLLREDVDMLALEKGFSQKMIEWLNTLFLDAQNLLNYKVEPVYYGSQANLCAQPFSDADLFLATRNPENKKFQLWKDLISGMLKLMHEDDGGFHLDTSGFLFEPDRLVFEIAPQKYEDKFKEDCSALSNLMVPRNEEKKEQDHLENDILLRILTTLKIRFAFETNETVGSNRKYFRDELQTISCLTPFNGILNGWPITLIPLGLACRKVDRTIDESIKKANTEKGKRIPFKSDFIRPLRSILLGIYYASFPTFEKAVDIHDLFKWIKEEINTKLPDEFKERYIPRLEDVRILYNIMLEATYYYRIKENKEEGSEKKEFEKKHQDAQRRFTEKEVKKIYQGLLELGCLFIMRGYVCAERKMTEGTLVNFKDFIDILPKYYFPPFYCDKAHTRTQMTLPIYKITQSQDSLIIHMTSRGKPAYSTIQNYFDTQGRQNPSTPKWITTTETSPPLKHCTDIVNLGENKFAVGVSNAQIKSFSHDTELKPRLSKLPADNKIGECLAANPDGLLALATAENSLYFYNQNLESIKVSSRHTTLIESHGKVTMMRFLSKSLLFVVHGNNNFITYEITPENPKQGEIVLNVKTAHNIKKPEITKKIIDCYVGEDKKIILLDENGTLSQFLPQQDNEQFKNITPLNLVDGNSISAMTQSGSKQLIVGTESGKLYKVQINNENTDSIEILNSPHKEKIIQIAYHHTSGTLSSADIDKNLYQTKLNSLLSIPQEFSA